jgi:hypothetical protein
LDVYVGGWLNDAMDGYGVYTWSGSNPVHGSFSGHLKGGKKWGRGKEVWKNGQRYDGHFADGWKNGFGTLVFSRKSQFASYSGHFKEDLMNGHGSLAWKNGDAYHGDFVSGAMHGSGKMVWAGNGNGEVRFKGHWNQGFMDGWGSLHFRKTGDTFDGYFQEKDGQLWMKKAETGIRKEGPILASGHQIF